MSDEEDWSDVEIEMVNTKHDDTIQSSEIVLEGIKKDHERSGSTDNSINSTEVMDTPSDEVFVEFDINSLNVDKECDDEWEDVNVKECTKSEKKKSKSGDHLTIFTKQVSKEMHKLHVGGKLFILSLMFVHN